MQHQVAILIATFVGSLVLVFGDQVPATGARPASIGEIQELFDLAVARPLRSHFVAEIELIQDPGTQDEVAAALKRQNEVMKERDKRHPKTRMAGIFAARSNAVLQSMSGRRIQHVEEWYSGHYNRLDETDEALTRSTNYLLGGFGSYRSSYVNIHDKTFSPYASFAANHELRDVTLTKNLDTTYHTPNDLWRAFGLDKQLIFEIIYPLVDFNSIDTNAMQTLGLLDIDLRWTPKTRPPVKMDFRRSAGEEKADYESKTQTA